MSSVIAHAVAAAAIGICADGRDRRVGGWAVVPLLAFAWLPDGDYALRLVGIGDPALRVSHSVVFVIGVWLAFVFAARTLPPLRTRVGDPACLLACLASGLSHLLLDWLVGSSWGDPLLWPVSADLLSSPVGILPYGSSRMDLSTVRTWRNLAMEFGVLAPIAWAALEWRRGRLGPFPFCVAATVVVASALWAASLPR